MTFNGNILGKWLWHFGLKEMLLWRHVVAVEYGEEWGGWCTKSVRGTHDCGLWKSISMDGKGFYSIYACFDIGEGSCVWF